MKRMLLLLMLVSAVFAYDACRPEFNEHVIIRVVDEFYRPIPNVTVELVYQRIGHVKPQTYFTLTKITNSSGLVDFWVQNLERDKRFLDCDLNVTLKYHGYEYKANLSMKNFLYTFLIKVPFYRVTFRLFEGSLPVKGKIVIGTDWIIENVSSVTVYLPKGKYSIAVCYKGMTRYLVVDIEKDRYVDITFQKYKARLTVKSDAGEDLSCILLWDGKNVSFTGSVELSLVSKNTTGTLVCGQYSANVLISAGLNNVFYIDTTPPKVTVENVDLIDDIAYVDVTVNDVGDHASGVRNVYLVYNGKKILPSVMKGSLYTFEFQYQGGNATIYAEDGNKNTIFQKIEIESFQVREVPMESESEDGISFIWIILIVVGIGLAYWIYKVMR